VIVAIVGRAWADHGGTLTAPPMAPWLYAMLWGLGALAVGLAVVAIIGVVTRRRSAER